MKEHGIDTRRLKLAAICTVCTKPFLKEVRLMDELLQGIGSVKDEISALPFRQPTCLGLERSSFWNNIK